MHKKLFVMFIILLLTITLAGCGGSSDDTSSTDTSSDTEERQTLGDMMKDPEKEAQIAKQHEMAIGEAGDIEGVGITLKQVYITEGDDYASSQLTVGHIYLVCEMNFNNQSQATVEPFLYSYKLYANDEDCPQETVSSGNSIYSISELAPGKNVNANVDFMVPQDASTFELQIKPDSVNEDDKDVLVYKFDTSEIGKN